MRMPGRVIAVLVGAALAFSGVSLALEKARVFDARLVSRDAGARDAGARRGGGAGERAEAAWTATDEAAGRRTDVAALRLELAGFAEAKAPRDGPAGGRGDALLDAASRLAALSPARGEAWCALAGRGLSLRGFDARTARQLELCHRVAPREIGLVEGRMLLAMIAWPLLSPPLRSLALADIANALGDGGYANWMADRLAYASVAVAPERRDLAEAMARQYGERVYSGFAGARRRYLAALENAGGKR